MTLRTSNLDHAIEAVSGVYCPHTIQVLDRARVVNAFLRVSHPTNQPLVELSYSAQVHIDAEDFRDLFLIMHCARGGARTWQEDRRADWCSGQTIPFSASFETQLWFNGDFLQQGVRLDMKRLENQCAQMLGHPLERPLRFALRPFSQELEQVWSRTLALLMSIDTPGFHLSDPAKASLDEVIRALLLEQHPHNYSDELARPARAPVPGLIRRAEEYMAEHAGTLLTPSDAAAEVGISLRSLQAGFRRLRNETPGAFLRRVRLQNAYDELRRSNGEVSVTDVALRCGFAHLGRFSSSYQAAFGELPSDTLRRARLSNQRRGR